MNRLYLPKHIVQVTGVPVRVYKKSGETGWKEFLALTPDGVPSHPIPDQIFTLCTQETLSMPSLVLFQYSLYYGLVPWEGMRLLFGPARLSMPLALRNHILEKAPPISTEEAPLCETFLFLQEVLLPWNLTAKREMTVQELIAASCDDSANSEVQQYYAEVTYRNREKGTHHNSYNQEVRLLGCIERGDLKMLEQCQQETSSGEFGVLSSNMDRSVKNLCVSAVVLASRAAIRGGLNPESAFSLCDAYIVKIDAVKDLTQTKSLVEGAQTNFAALVHSLKTDALQNGSSHFHPLVAKCKDYIYDNLHGKVTLKDASEALGAPANYLSTLFKKYEGISFSEFVMREKISLAKELLIYSPLSYGDIAATLGFSSQSHMGEHFKRLTGMTPIQFRKRFAVHPSG